MKLLLIAGFAFAALCFAEGEDVLAPLMKSNGATAGKLRKDVEAKSEGDIAMGAMKLQGNFKMIAEYFAKRGGADDAVKIARDAEMASKELAASPGDPAKVDAAMKTINGSCGSCHMAHRMKMGDAYMIK